MDAGSCWRWLCALVVLMPVTGARAYTEPNNFNKLVAFRDSMKVRSPNWAAALSTWTCPTRAANSAPPGSCDPCGQGYNGNWYHMHCRGNSRGWGESGDGVVNGITTNMHITSSLIDGPVPKEICAVPTIREHDVGGQLNRGHLTGPFPHWLAKCFPDLEELDLSNNRLTGTLPAYLASMDKLSEIKVENNGFIGTIPPELGSIKRLRRFQTEFNNMRGRIPESFKNAAPYLTQLHLARNDYEGDLSMFVNGHLTTVTVHDNPKLCGMVPATVRFAKGYNPGNTGLGKPCSGTSGSPTAVPAPPPSEAPGTATASPTDATTSVKRDGNNTKQLPGARPAASTSLPEPNQAGGSEESSNTSPPPQSPPASPAAAVNGDGSSSSRGGDVGAGDTSTGSNSGSNDQVRSTGGTGQSGESAGSGGGNGSSSGN